MKPGEVAQRLRDFATEAERITNDVAPGATGRNYARGLGYLVGSLEAFAESLDDPEQSPGVEQCQKCKRFLSSARVEMRLVRCSRCDR